MLRVQPLAVESLNQVPQNRKRGAHEHRNPKSSPTYWRWPRTGIRIISNGGGGVVQHQQRQTLYIGVRRPLAYQCTTHSHTNTRRHERCPWCRRRRVSSSSNGGTGQERYTGNTIHRGGSRVVAHHRAYQYGTRYIGRAHARTDMHALTLSRSVTAARARPHSTHTHAPSVGRTRTPTFTHTRKRARPRVVRYPTAHVRRPATAAASYRVFNILFGLM